MISDPWSDRPAWESDGLLFDGQNMSYSATQNMNNIQYDIVIVGSGPGGAVAAERLAQAGLAVAIVEAGPLMTASDFTGSESIYQHLYQDGMFRATADSGIHILQGACVGGSATVNWTSCFRLPQTTAQFWAEKYHINDLSSQLEPYYVELEKYLNVKPWLNAPNNNNEILQKGTQQLGWSSGVIQRNVKECWDLGYCGLGCPTNAKQSPLVTFIPQALKHGAHLYFNTQVKRLIYDKGQVSGVYCEIASFGKKSELPLKARHVVLAGGAINTPAILMRSQLDKLNPNIGRRTFLHPGAVCLAQFDFPINGSSGAPQSIYSDEFLWPDISAARCGFKMEAVPLQAGFASGLLGRHGNHQFEDMQLLSHTHAMISLLRDGFETESQGGIVQVNGSRSIKLYYPVSALASNTFKFAIRSMAQCQFAAGAQRVRPSHLQANQWFASIQELDAFLNNASYDPARLSLGSAHVMGGCPMSGYNYNDSQAGVVDLNGIFNQIKGLSVADASVFPTSLGVNPQLTIMAMSAMLSDNLAKNF